MAKRTVASIYQNADMAAGLQRRLLSVKLDSKEIFYEEEKYFHEQGPVSVEGSEDAPVKTASEALAPPASVTPSAPHQRMALPSAPVTAAEVVRTIVATTLKVPIAKVSMDSTIKGFAAGTLFIRDA